MKKYIIFILICSPIWALMIQITKDLSFQGSLLLFIGWVSAMIYQETIILKRKKIEKNEDSKNKTGEK